MTPVASTATPHVRRPPHATPRRAGEGSARLPPRAAPPPPPPRRVSGALVRRGAARRRGSVRKGEGRARECSREWPAGQCLARRAGPLAEGFPASGLSRPRGQGRSADSERPPVGHGGESRCTARDGRGSPGPSGDRDRDRNRQDCDSHRFRVGPGSGPGLPGNNPSPARARGPCQPRSRCQWPPRTPGSDHHDASHPGTVTVRCWHRQPVPKAS